MFARLAALFRRPAPPAIPARRIAAVLASPSERATACEWGGRGYWRG